MVGRRFNGHSTFSLCRPEAFPSGRNSPEDAPFMPQTYGVMITFIVEGEGDVALERVKKVCEGSRVVNLAVSLGRDESPVEHPYMKIFWLGRLGFDSY